MPESYVIEHVEFRPPIWGIPQTERAESIGYANLGRKFYVHGSLGVDINDSEGLLKDFPLLTITNALSRCTASANDIIEVLYYPSAGAVGEVWPININKRGVKLIGGTGEDWADAVRILRPPVGSAVTVPCIVVNADEVEIAGLWIEGLAVGGSTAGGIELGTTASFAKTHIHHCNFGWQTPLQDGIRAYAGFDCPSLLIHDNVFNDKITRDGVRLSQNATRGLIYNNIFRFVAGVGIHLQALCTDVYAIFGNVFRVADGLAGQAITCNINSLGCMIYDNKAMEGKVAFANIPWVDAGANHWANNMSNILLVNPA
jgi:hypothetical protein